MEDAAAIPPNTDRPVRLHDSAMGRAAAHALFVDSDLPRAQTLAEHALRRDRQDAEALFVRMELAGMEADHATVVETALRLCETGASTPADARVRLAAARLRESAANTPDFRQIVTQLPSLAITSPQLAPQIYGALLNAAMDGVPGLNPYSLARAAGILTDWRIVGPLASHSLLGLDKQLISSADDLSLSSYQNHTVENFQFADGWIRLPDYLWRRGVFYAAGRFASLTPAAWSLELESAGAVELYVDGQRVLQSDVARRHLRADFDAMAGPHRVMLKFAASAAPLRIAISRRPQPARAVLRPRIPLEEATYLLAAEHYVDGNFAAAINQINAVHLDQSSAPLEFLLAQSSTRHAPGSSESLAAWKKLHSSTPAALAAVNALAQQALANGDSSRAVALAREVLTRAPASAEALAILTEAALSTDAPASGGLWSRRLAAHSSCEAWQQAMHFYSAAGLSDERDSAQQKLDGCAPESLAYAQSLADDGKHADATRSLESLVAAAPLNRAARFMLIRELQLAGDDESAERAAAEWQHVAPNAESYHRLAAAYGNSQDTTAQGSAFYAAYRRDAATIAKESSTEGGGYSAVELLDDHVALCRADGSVSLYVHFARRLLSQAATSNATQPKIPQGAQVIRLRILRAAGSWSDSLNPSEAEHLALDPGDAIDEEYVLNFAGDGGIPEHAEVFQYVFGNFTEPVLHSRFVVLTAADHAGGGVVISTGEPPLLKTKLIAGMIERSWERNIWVDLASAAKPPASQGMAIIRVVEQENGWSEPSSAEHQRRIETIHPGPRPADS